MCRLKQQEQVLFWLCDRLPVVTVSKWMHGGMVSIWQNRRRSVRDEVEQVMLSVRSTAKTCPVSVRRLKMMS